MKIYCSDREKGERNKQFNKNQTGCLLVSDLACGASGLAGGASGLAGWRADARKISPFYMTSSPIGQLHKKDPTPGHLMANRLYQF